MKSGFTLIAVALLGLSACSGMTSVRNAEEACAQNADLSDGIRGQVRAGIGTNGPTGGLSITVTDRILNPTTPEEFYDNCVFQRSGQAPTRTLVQVLG